MHHTGFLPAMRALAMHQALAIIGILFALAGCTDSASPGPVNHDWPVYLGDKSSSHYSGLDQVNRDNVQQLQVAWTYHAGGLWDANMAKMPTNPLVINGVLYGVSPAIDVFALNAASGEEIWRFDGSRAERDAPHPLNRFMGQSRGLSYWTDGSDERLFISRGPYLCALDAKTGELIPGFGDAGAVDLRDDLGRDVSGLFITATSPGIIFQDLLIQGSRVGEGPDSAPGHIRAYDVRTGAVVWTFHTIPQPGESGYETWPADAWQYAGGANSWAGLALDEARGIVYVPTGSATFDLWGGNRKGQNLFANSLVALEAKTGKRVWHFQMVHHDIWDRDLPAPPNLLTVEQQGRKIDAVAQITKNGLVFLFDRVTGEPLFPISERPVAASLLRGEEAWPTQPFPALPAPFARQFMTEADISDLNPANRDELQRRFQGLNSAGQYVPIDTQGVVLFPGFDGGGEWGGAAVDPGGILYVNANEMPWIAVLFDRDAERDNTAGLPLGEKTYQTYCSGCHGQDRAGNLQQSVPSLLDLASRSTPDLAQQTIKRGNSFMPSFLFLPENETRALLAYLFGMPEPALAEETPQPSAQPAGPSDVPYAFMGFNRFVDEQGYPAVKPPWGTLSAIDLNSGAYLWQVPLGEYPELTARGIAITGSENYGGPIATGGGLVFIAATKDQKIRAFDKQTGQVLWEAPLPAAGFATPSTYMIDGRQYIVIAAGGGKIGMPSGDAYVAFALPSQDDKPESAAN